MLPVVILHVQLDEDAGPHHLQIVLSQGPTVASNAYLPMSRMSGDDKAKVSRRGTDTEGGDHTSVGWDVM